MKYLAWLTMTAVLSNPLHAADKMRVLIVDGFSNHDWRRNTAMIRGIIEPTGLFTVDVSTSPPSPDAPGWDAWRPRFKDYAVVIQTCNDIGKDKPRWPAEVERDFEAFVREGGGVYVYHSGNNAFPHWQEYNRMIGLGWRKPEFGYAVTVSPDGRQLQLIPAGEGSGTGHGPRSTVLIERRGDHPIHAGFPRAWLTPDLEIYTYARGPAEEIDVLSYARDAKFSLNWPIEWTIRYGKGRVYTSTFGHVMKTPSNPESMRCVGYRTLMIRTLQWLGWRLPDFPLPENFPTAETASLVGEIE